MEIQNLHLDQIEATAATQARARTDKDTVAEYAERMKAGDVFPRPVVFAEVGAQTGFFLADGFHRIQAAMAAGLQEMSVEVHEGNLRDAIKYALQANERHGLRRTHKDKRSAVLFAMKDAEWSEMSNRQLADLCNVSHTFVATVRAEMDEKKARKTGNNATDSAQDQIEQNLRPTLPQAAQSDVTLRALQDAFETIATCEIDGFEARQRYKDRLGTHFARAGEWMDEARLDGNW